MSQQWAEPGRGDDDWLVGGLEPDQIIRLSVLRSLMLAPLRSHPGGGQGYASAYTETFANRLLEVDKVLDRYTIWATTGKLPNRPY